MPTEDNPRGKAYLKTFQALFQLTEIIILLVTWALVVSQKFYTDTALCFAVGVFLFIWLLTVFYFIMYITAWHMKINDFFGKITGSTRQSGSGEDAEYQPQNVAWFACEHVTYFILDLFLFIAVVIVSAKIIDNAYIAAAAFGWFSFVVYTLHYCLLVKNTEGVWPHRLALECFEHCQRKRQETNENQGLLSQPPDTAEP